MHKENLFYRTNGKASGATASSRLYQLLRQIRNTRSRCSVSTASVASAITDSFQPYSKVSEHGEISVDPSLRAQALSSTLSPRRLYALAIPVGLDYRFHGLHWRASSREDESSNYVTRRSLECSFRIQTVYECVQLLIGEPRDFRGSHGYAGLGIRSPGYRWSTGCRPVQAKLYATGFPEQDLRSAR
jgi:hypothetical protein